MPAVAIMSANPKLRVDSSRSTAKAAARRKALRRSAHSSSLLAGKAGAGKSKMKHRGGKKGGPAIPQQVEIDQAIAHLNHADRVAVHRILSGLEQHLGSPEAARLWLVTTTPAFTKPPLAVIADGNEKEILAVLESRWGPSPSYA